MTDPSPASTPDEQPTVCLHCGYALEVGMGPGSTYWVHQFSGTETCAPTYASPVFPGNVIWHPPRDAGASR
jgi:hypothetical protein